MVLVKRVPAEHAAGESYTVSGLATLWRIPQRAKSFVPIRLPELAVEDLAVYSGKDDYRFRVSCYLELMHFVVGSVGSDRERQRPWAKLKGSQAT